MKSLRKRIESLELYLNSQKHSVEEVKLIGSVNRSMASGRITKTLDKTRSTRTSDKIKTSI